jgi:hypothetical protein
MEADPSPAVSTVRVIRAAPEPAAAGRISLRLPLKLARLGSGVAVLADETDTNSARRNNPMEERLKK